MYPASLHRNPTQTVASSQIFERRILQKQPNVIHKITKSWDKNTIKDLEQVCPKQSRIFLSWLMSSKKLLPRFSYLLDQSSALYAQFFNNESQRKKLNRFKIFFSVVSYNTFHFTNITTLNVALSSYQTFLPYALHNEMWSCVCMVNSSKSNFLHQRHLELWESRDFPNFPPLYPINCQESCIFLFLLQNIQPLQLLEECLKAHCNPNIHCSAQFYVNFLVHPNVCFVGWHFYGGRNEYPWTLTLINSQFLDHVFICQQCNM